MKLSRAPRSLLSIVILLAISQTLSAKPVPPDVPFGEIANAIFLQKRCANPCGYNGLCCGSGQQCYTDSSNEAQCGGSTAAPSATAQANGGQWQYYTTTYVETDLATHVSTYSSYISAVTVQAATPASAAAPATTSQLQCSSGCMPCGSICCSSGQFCAWAGQCSAGTGDVSSSAYGSYLASSTSQTYSAPLRPTTGATTSTSTSTSSASATVPFQTPVGTAGNIIYGTGTTNTNAGLSGGAIAGIVIGVIAGIALLLLFCCFACGVAGVRSLFGGGRRNRRDTTYVHESHHSGHGSGGASRPGWWGAQTRPARTRPPGGAIGPIAAGLGALALALGLKRRHDRKRRSEYSSESSDYSYYDTSESKSSSPDLTRL